MTDTRVGGVDEPTAAELLALVDKYVLPFAAEDAPVLVSRLLVNLAQRERTIGGLKGEVRLWKNLAKSSRGEHIAAIRMRREVHRTVRRAAEGAREAERAYVLSWLREWGHMLLAMGIERGDQRPIPDAPPRTPAKEDPHDPMV